MNTSTASVTSASTETIYFAWAELRSNDEVFVCSKSLGAYLSPPAAIRAVLRNVPDANPARLLRCELDYRGYHGLNFNPVAVNVSDEIDKRHQWSIGYKESAVESDVKERLHEAGIHVDFDDNRFGSKLRDSKELEDFYVKRIMDFVNSKPETRTVCQVMKYIADKTLDSHVDATTFGMRTYQVSTATLAAGNLPIPPETVSAETGLKVLFAVNIVDDELSSQMFGPFSVLEPGLTRVALAAFLSSPYAMLPTDVLVSSAHRISDKNDIVEHLVGILLHNLMESKDLGLWSQQLVAAYAIPETDLPDEFNDAEDINCLHFVIANVVVSCAPDALDGVIVM
jgi:hypothetical protein